MGVVLFSEGKLKRNGSGEEGAGKGKRSGEMGNSSQEFMYERIIIIKN